MQRARALREAAGLLAALELLRGVVRTRAERNEPFMRSYSLRLVSLFATSAASLLAACGGSHEHTDVTTSASVTELAWNYVNTTNYKTVKQLAVAPEADGRVTVFELFTDGTLFRATQNSPSGGWIGAPVDMGAHALLQIAAIPNADGRIEVLALGGDRAVYHVWETAPNGSWGAWASLGGSQIQSVTAARDADGRLEAFVVGGDHAVYHSAQQGFAGGSFGGWAYLGGSQIQSVQVANDASGALNLFAIGGDSHVYSMKQLGPNASFGVWSRPLFDNTAISMIAPIANLDGRLELVVRRTDGEMMHTWQTTPNGAFYGSYWDYGFSNVSEFTLAREADGRIVLFGVQDQGLFTLQQVAPNGSWTSRLGALAYSGVHEVHVAAGNGRGGAIRLFTSTGYNSIGQLDEAGPNGPWETNQVNPLAQMRAFNVPSSSYVSQPMQVGWSLSTDAYCSPSVKITAMYTPSNRIIYEHTFTSQTSGTSTFTPDATGDLLVYAEPSCTNGAAGTRQIKPSTITMGPPPVCGVGNPPPSPYGFCVTFTSGPFPGSCGAAQQWGCTEAQAEAIVKSEEPSDALVVLGPCPANCNL